MGLHRGPPKVDALVLAPLGEELGDRPVFVVGGGGSEVAPGLLLEGAVPQAGALLRAVWGLGAPRSVRERLSPEAQRIAFGRADR